MKVYNYTPKDADMTEFPPGKMRLAGTEVTTNPDEADVFVLPCIMYHLGVAKIRALPYLKGNETRHAFLNISENLTMFMGFPGMFFRCDCTKRILEHDPTTISWPWPVDDLAGYVPLPEGGFQYDVTFRGWVSTDLTSLVCNAIKENPRLNTNIQCNNTFYGYLSAAEAAPLRADFLQALQVSRLSLVPRSIPDGVVRYRFYEAMSMGRVPVHFCDLCVLPFSDRIDYGLCSLHIPEDEAPRAGYVLEEWLSSHSDDDIIEMGRYGRAMYERWLHRDKWNELFTEVIKEKLRL